MLTFLQNLMYCTSASKRISTCTFGVRRLSRLDFSRDENVTFIDQNSFGALGPHRHAHDQQIPQRSKVALHENPQGELGGLDADEA